MASASRYRRAHGAGERGQGLPKGLADLADDDPEIDNAYQAGQAGEPFDDFEQARAARAPAAPAPATSSPRRLFSSGQGAGETGGGLVVGAVAYALLLSLVNYGAGGPTAWFKAKFLNQPTAPAAKSSAGAKS